MTTEFEAALQRAALSKCACGHTFDRHENPHAADEGVPGILYTDSCKVDGCECKGFVTPRAG